MPNIILIHIKNLVKLLMLQRFVIGPLLTLAALTAHAWAVAAGLLPTSAAGLYLLILYAGFIGGVRSGLISAALLAIYNAAFLGPMTIERGVVFASYFAAAGLVGWKTRQWREALAEAQAGVEARRMVDNLNGNITRVEEARTVILGILENDRLDEPTRNRLRSVLHTLNNLALATRGWAELRELRADIERARTKPMEGHAGE